MSGDAARLARWLRRARPTRRDLARALVAGLAAALVGAGLFVGAVALLVVSAQRPGLATVAGFLILIELLAVARSPMRFAERLSAHRLGFAAVTQWRRWLMLSVGRWDYSRWRRHAAGDLLERSLRDTEELQDLWLRGVVPATGALAVLVAGDLAVALLAPHGAWWGVVAGWLALQGVALGALRLSFAPLVGADRAVRAGRAHYRATVVELSAAAPELALLGAHDLLDARSRAAVGPLVGAETRARRRAGVVDLVAPLSALGELGLLGWLHPRASTTWLVVAALVALSSADALGAVRDSLGTLVEVSAAGERLEDLDTVTAPATAPWPADATLVLEGLTIVEGARHLFRDTTLRLAPGQRVAVVGPSGSGKSALLRVAAGLDPPATGRVAVNDVDLVDLDEAQLRERLAYVPSEPDLTTGFAGDAMLLGREARRDPFADLLGLGVVASPATRWEGLSRGERERVALARALVTSPDVVVLDEPTAGLGTRETDAALDLLARSGAAVLVATHDRRVMDWCEEVLEVRDGALVALRR